MCLKTMSETPKSQITMRIPLDRPPTEDDHPCKEDLDIEGVDILLDKDDVRRTD